jgi:hypothetical protein
VGGLQPIYSSSVYNSRLNFDGYLIAEQFNNSSTVVSAYLQLFRNGIFESVNTLGESRPPSSKLIPSLELEGTLLHKLPSYLTAMAKLGIRPPIFMALSLIGTSGYSMQLEPLAARSYGSRGGTIDEQSLIMSEVMIESPENDFGELFRPVFDAIWNAAGWEQSIYYEGSKWTGISRFVPR